MLGSGTTVVRRVVNSGLGLGLTILVCALPFPPAARRVQSEPWRLTSRSYEDWRGGDRTQLHRMVLDVLSGMPSASKQAMACTTGPRHGRVSPSLWMWQWLVIESQNVGELEKGSVCGSGD